jgi:NADP-dependent 3-hydroxy acid dehydrogenase YdfG
MLLARPYIEVASELAIASIVIGRAIWCRLVSISLSSLPPSPSVEQTPRAPSLQRIPTSEYKTSNVGRTCHATNRIDEGNEMQNIQGKVVIITGASSGFGANTARYLAGLGAKVVLGARRIDRLEEVAISIRAKGGEVAVVKTDVTKRGDVQSLVGVALSDFGRIDVMFNNAGRMAIAPLDADKAEEWDAMIDVNIKGVLYGISAALPIFRKQNDGHLINVASVGALKVLAPGGVVYCGTKFAVRAISEGLRIETGPNIRTTILSPGVVDSELKFGSSDAQSAAAMLEFYKIAIPTETIAHAIAYAISQPKEVDINEIVLRPTSWTRKCSRDTWTRSCSRRLRPARRMATPSSRRSGPAAARSSICPRARSIPTCTVLSRRACSPAPGRYHRADGAGASMP